MTRYTLGHDGPVTIITGEVADLIEPLVRAYETQLQAGGASAEARATVQEWAASVYATAAAWRRSVSAECADVGQLHDRRSEMPDPDLVMGWRTSTVAERLHLDPRTVTRLIGPGGPLTGQKVGREWVVDPRSVAAYEARGDA